MKILSQDIPALLEESYTDFIVKGLDVLVLSTKPFAQVEAYIARADHELWKNSVDNEGKFTLPLANYPVQIELRALFGRISIIRERHIGTKLSLEEFYIRNDGSWVRTLNQPKGFTLLPEPLGKSSIIQPEQYCSIHVPQGERAAWMSLHIEALSSKQRLVYTNNPLPDVPFRGKLMPREQFYIYLGMLDIQVVEAA